MFQKISAACGAFVLFAGCSSGFRAPSASTGAASGHGSFNSQSVIGVPVSGYSLIVASQANGYTYGYGPSIIYTQGKYYAYYCSTDNVYGWDKIRMVSSTDQNFWSTPVEMLRTSNYGIESAACDPSIVRGADGMYYLFYGGSIPSEQGGIFVARSNSPAGPFAKYTADGTWAVNPSNPKPIRHVLHPVPNGTSPITYGNGQPSVVFHNGVFYMWYMDDSETYPQITDRIYVTLSNDGVNWTPPQRTNVEQASVDVKFDPATGLWLMFEMENQHRAGASIAVRTSADGVTFSAPESVCANGSCLPNFSNNLGVSGDEHGALLNHEIMVGYGTPYNAALYLSNDCRVSPAPNCWAYWNLGYSRFSLSISGQVTAPISYGSILAGVPISCDYLNPDAIKSLSEETILWLASIQPSGLTLHENYLVARQTGYNGAFGHGEHNAWLDEDPARRAAFTSAVQALASAPLDGFGTFANHHVIRRAAGYRGLFLCGGGACFDQGQCDDLGRRR